MREAEISIWYRRYKLGRESDESDPRSGSHSQCITHKDVKCVWIAIE